MNKSDNFSKLSAALVKAQAEMPVAGFNSRNNHLGNKYADLGAVIEAARPVLAKYGLAVSQPIVEYTDGIGIETILIHESGEWMSTTAGMKTGSQKGLNDAQVAGLTISYLRRYSLASLLGMYSDEDTDGQHRQQQQPPKSSGKPAATQETPGDFDKYTYEDGSTVQAGDNAKAQAERKSFDEYTAAHDGKVPANVFNLRAWVKKVNSEN